MARVSGPLNRPLCCELCNLIEFSSYSEFHRHHLRHIRQPYVKLTRLSPNVLEAVRSGSYRVSPQAPREPATVSPIKLSVVKEAGTDRFLIINKKDLAKYISTYNSRASPKHIFSRLTVDSRSETEPEEGKLKLLIPQVSEPRSRRATTPDNTKEMKEMNPQTLKKNLVREKGKEGTSEEVHHGAGGDTEALSMSVGIQDSTSEHGLPLPDTESRPTSSGVAIFNNEKSIDLNDLRKLKNRNNDNEIRVVDNNRILEKFLSGSDVSLETKSKVSKSPKILIREPSVALGSTESGELDPHTSGSTPAKRPKFEDNNGNSTLSNNSNTPITQVEEPAKVTMVKEETPTSAQPKQPRTKQSNRGRSKRQSSQDVDVKSPQANPRERKVDNVGGITGRRKSSAGTELSADQVATREDTQTTREPSLMPSTSGVVPLQTDLSVYSSAQTNRVGIINWETTGGTIIQTWNVTSAGLLTSKPCLQPTPQASTNNASSGGDSAGVSATLINPDLKNQDGNVPAFVKIPVCSENLQDSIVAEAEEVREIFGESVTSDGHDSRRGPHQPNEQAAIWSRLQQANNPNANNQQNALTGHNNLMQTKEGLKILQNFIAEQQLQHGPIPADNSEYMALEHLAAQHQQALYNMNNPEVATPMEQLTEQVQRMPNPTPQISVIPPHQLQAPPPLHPAGVPLSQHPVSYDALGRMQPTMGPPPLFQGYSVFPNQAFQQPGTSQQVIPRPPALRQYPQIQVGAFPTMAPQTRPRGRTAKRSMPALPPAPELVVPKQRRSEPAIKGKSQLSKDKTKGKAPINAATKPVNTPIKPATKPVNAPTKPATRAATTAVTKAATTAVTKAATAALTKAAISNITKAVTITVTKAATAGTKPATTAGTKPATTAGTKLAANTPNKPATRAATRAATTPATTPTTTQATKPATKPSAKASANADRAPQRVDPVMIARILAARGITVTPSASRQTDGVHKTQRNYPARNPVLNLSSAISITPTVHNKTKYGKKFGNITSDLCRNSGVIINIGRGRPSPVTVDLTDDDPQDLSRPGPSVNRFLCNQCGQKFPTAASLELHKETHREPDPTAFSCDICNLQFSIAEDLERHNLDTHKYRGRGRKWVIPVVDLDIPGAEERLVENGITNFIPLSLDDEDGTHAIPIIQYGAPHRERDLLGVSNVIVLGELHRLMGRREEAE